MFSKASIMHAVAIVALATAMPAWAQHAEAPVAAAAVPAPEVAPGVLTVLTDQPGAEINRDIFGQFAEHLGEGIYEGVWVGPDSPIPNVRGIRSDVVDALRAIRVPVVRWPGGCYADEYHWRSGIGPANERHVTVNTNWANAVEPNTFGTHEFMDFADQIGAEAYLSVNVGSGTVQEAAEWLEYMTAEAPASLAAERTANGHADPYQVRYLGLGNEMWGCGGPLTPDEYVTRMKTFAHFVHNQNPAQANPPIDFALIARDLMSGRPMAPLPSNPNGMLRIAAGPNSADPSYTEVIMRAWQTRSPIYWDINGISLHQYTWGSAPFAEPSTGFGEQAYANILMQSQWMERTINRHSEIMDRYDPGKHIALVVDEWGVWLRPNEGTETMFLQQQNSLRDALAAVINLNIFARHSDRVRMTNIAQMVNVLQAMIMTDDGDMVLTPTYHVYKMYVPFQDATFLPLDFNAGTYVAENITLPRVDAIAARGTDGNVYLSLSNLDPDEAVELRVRVPGVRARSAVGEVLTAERVDSVNTFADPDAVEPEAYTARAVNGELVLRLPAKSLTVVRVVE